MNKNILILLCSVVVIGSVGGFFLVSKMRSEYPASSLNKLEDSSDKVKVEKLSTASSTQKSPIIKNTLPPKDEAEASTTDVSPWRTYHSATLGLSFKYPNDSRPLVLLEEDGSVTVPSFSKGLFGSGINISTTSLNSEFKTGLEYSLKYNKEKNNWISDESGAYKASCEEVFPLGTQLAPSYNLRVRHMSKFAVIYGSKILIVTEVFDDMPIPPDAHPLFDKITDSITFDNPNQITKATCPAIVK